METKKTTEQRPLWIRAGASVGGVALALSLSGCGLFKSAAHEADNPGARKMAEEALGLGGQAARDSHYGGAGKAGVRAFDFGNTLTYTKSTGDTVGSKSYTEAINHTEGATDDGELTEDEVSTIECTIKTLVQAPAGTQEVVEGSSILQRGDDGAWIETITNNAKGGPPDICEIVLSALPGASAN